MSTNTNPIDLLKDRRRERLAEAARIYWAEVLAIVTSKPIGERMADAVSRIDLAAATLGKDEATVEADVQLLQELIAAGPRQVASDHAAIAARFAAADARIRAAEAAVETAQRDLAEAGDARQVIAGEASRINQQRLRIDFVRSQLAASGCPDELTKF